jgi:murein DD-endopeptidase MepM/ murein hydrolase activator NlpD
MHRVAEPRRSLSWSRLAIFAAIGVGAVSCSSESSRFDNPFSSRSVMAPGEVTGSVPNKSASVQRKPLPPPNTAAMQPPATRPAVAPVTGGAKGMVSYQPAPATHEITGSVPAAAPQPVATPARSGWTWEGGTPITVSAGDTADTLGRRYGVPASAIVQANGLSSPTAIKPGQRLVIPRYEAPLTTASAPPRPAAAAPAKPAPVVSAPATTTSTHVHIVAPGETLSKVARQYKKSVPEIAAANKIPPHTMVKMGDRLIIPGLRGQPQVAAAPAPQQPVPVVQSQQKPAANPKVASAVPTATTTARTITPAADNPAPEAKPDVVAASIPTFRWPVRGRVITGFGPKPSGQQNDGINVAVPEGTPVKAAEDGVVAYAGNELKTYGNLVLIRHSNGFVTAYAHASEILVKRDEPIKRGQVIAKSGQTGNVAAPQLHFEIRKGSSPVDPIPYLDKGGST